MTETETLYHRAGESETARLAGNSNPPNHGQHDWDCGRCGITNVRDSEHCRGCGGGSSRRDGPPWWDTKIARITADRDQAWRDCEAAELHAQKLEIIILGMIRRINDVGNDGAATLEAVKAELKDTTAEPARLPMTPERIILAEYGSEEEVAAYDARLRKEMEGKSC